MIYKSLLFLEPIFLNISQNLISSTIIPGVPLSGELNQGIHKIIILVYTQHNLNIYPEIPFPQN